MLASIPGEGLFTNTTGLVPWTALPAPAGTAEASTVVLDPATPGAFWIGGTDGVFRIEDDGSAEGPIADLLDVRALSVDATGGVFTMLAVTTDGAVHWLANGAATWTPVTLPAEQQEDPPVARQVGAPLVLGPQAALVGTSEGVYRTVDGGLTWTRELPEGVVGAPLRIVQAAPAPTSISWLMANGGVVRSTDGGDTWPLAVSSGTVVPTVPHLVAGPGGQLMSARATELLVSAGGGAPWRTIGAALPYQPAGVAYSPAASATFIWPATCGQSVMRLADS